MYLSTARFNLGCHQPFSDSFGPQRPGVNLAPVLLITAWAILCFMICCTLLRWGRLLSQVNILQKLNNYSLPTGN